VKGSGRGSVRERVEERVSGESGESGEGSVRERERGSVEKVEKGY
jgi:hypothetical protein